MGKAQRQPPLPDFPAEADAEIARWFDIIDVKSLAALIYDTHGLTYSEMDIVIRAADLAGVVA